MNTFDVNKAIILSVVTGLVENINVNQKYVSTNLAATFSQFEGYNEMKKDIPSELIEVKSIHILNPRNLVFQPITPSRLLEVLSTAEGYTAENIEYLKNHVYFA